jgi:hypothetical protein
MFFGNKGLQRDLARSERQRKRAEQKLESSIDKDNAPKFLRTFIAAAEEGLLPTEALQALLEDIGKSLLFKSHTRCPTARSFYVTLLNAGSPWISQFVSMNMGGPHLRTVQRWRGLMYDYLPGRLEKNIDQLVALLDKMDLLDVPGMWSEDATTCHEADHRMP